MKEKILFITNLLPYPLDNGGKIKTFNTIESLSEKFDIDVICYISDEEDRRNIAGLGGIANDVQVVCKNLIRSVSFKDFFIDYMKSLMTKYPYNVNKFRHPDFERLISNKLSNNKYYAIYVDHLQMMVYYDLFNHENTILDQHNVESLIFKRLIQSENSVVKKALGAIEYKKLRKFEIGMLHKAGQVICLSEEDQKEFMQLGINKDKINILPIHLKSSYCKNNKSLSGEKFKLLFLGSMSWYPNQNGIKWFLENVWVSLDKRYYELYIVGSNPPETIKQYHNGENVHVTGYVEDINEYIEKCDISIVPLFIGSGQRVKIIESFAKGIPVISTSIGAEGLIYTNGEDIIIADTIEDFINRLEDVRSNRGQLDALTFNAHENFKSNYSAEFLPAKLQKIIENCRG
ncbi:glycosyltransferase [Bacillus cereus]|uniref:glycosyltransferase n=1 Tax=Bacillus cereus TaxID=1396 RepID=UPI00187A88C0|nr:glycosyltransferase [Bacillus cereus]MBE7097071.1 glycosyltransferase [Bacillus cereus]